MTTLCEKLRAILNNSELSTAERKIHVIKTHMERECISTLRILHLISIVLSKLETVRFLIIVLIAARFSRRKTGPG